MIDRPCPALPDRQSDALGSDGADGLAFRSKTTTPRSPSLINEAASADRLTPRIADAAESLACVATSRVIVAFTVLCFAVGTALRRFDGGLDTASLRYGRATFRGIDPTRLRSCVKTL